LNPLKIVRLGACSRKEREALLRRSELDVDTVLPRVTRIISDVRRNGDRALLMYTRRFNGVRLSVDEIRVKEGEFRAAFEQIDAVTAGAIKRAGEAIRRFHIRQLPRQWTAKPVPGVKAGQLVRPLERVGVYVPGGLARYPSSLLMAAIPARVAGVSSIVVCTPPDKAGKVNDAVLVAAEVAGVDAVFRVGGPQAIAAMAYGTETVPKVEKIVGPGNIYVAAAKRVVASEVGIEFVAGPSEVLIVADESAEPRFVAADLVSQAEHDSNAAAVLVTTSEAMASKVRELVGEMVRENPRKRIVLRALEKYGWIVVTRDLIEAIEFANAYAPEHLELMVKGARKLLKLVRNAGSIFVGPYSPVAAGDFAVGPNHILPTGGAASRCSGLSVLDFVKLPTVQELSKQGLRRLAGVVERLAVVEGLPGHAKSIRERFGEA
jgi:histidinol dehydrogenase